MKLHKHACVHHLNIIQHIRTTLNQYSIKHIIHRQHIALTKIEIKQIYTRIIW